MLLADLAKLLRISAPYLSQIETGQRFVPDGFEDRVVKELGLCATDAQELARAAASSRSQYHIDLGADATSDDRGLASDLAMSFAKLTPNAKAQIRSVLAKNKGTERG